MSTPLPTKRRSAPDAARSAAIGNLLVSALFALTGARETLIGLSGHLGPCASSERISHLPLGSALAASAGFWVIMSLIALDGGSKWRVAMFGMIPAGLLSAAAAWNSPNSDTFRHSVALISGVSILIAAAVAIRGDGRSSSKASTVTETH